MSLIRAQNVVVEFPIFNSSHRSLKKKLLKAAVGGRVHEEAGHNIIVRAVDNISFNFSAGDRIGLIGHNGSGKTTLLRVLAGVYEPVHGKLEVHGKVVSLLDMTMGMDHESTGYENIILRGLMMGIKPAVMRKKTDEIAEFSELGSYLSIHVRTYSSGMMLRLAFAISTSVQADILLLDEWLSVGDAEFNQKASARLEHMVKNSGIVVIASHDHTMIHRVCNRVIHLEKGRIIEKNETKEMDEINA
jgi:lipopolysaccharide transport system ATP-binding protein